MVMDQKELLRRIKDSLRTAYGERLQGVVLYGSEARGEAGPESDVDVLVLLEGPIEWWRDIKTTVRAIYDLQLQVERPIHAHPVDAADFYAGRYSLYRTVKEEGIFA